MLNILTLLFCASLALISFYDFKYRALPLYTLAIAFIFSIVGSIYSNGWLVSLYNAGINSLFVGIQMGLITLYFSLRSKKPVNIFRDHLGMGDLLFFAVLVFCFSPVNFILFIILSGILVLLFYLRSKKEVLIPLAGCLAFFLVIILFFSVALTIINPYNDLFLIDLLYN